MPTWIFHVFLQALDIELFEKGRNLRGSLGGSVDRGRVTREAVHLLHLAHATKRTLRTQPAAADAPFYPDPAQVSDRAERLDTRARYKLAKARRTHAQAARRANYVTDDSSDDEGYSSSEDSEGNTSSSSSEESESGDEDDEAQRRGERERERVLEADAAQQHAAVTNLVPLLAESFDALWDWSVILWSRVDVALTMSCVHSDLSLQV
jgi:hypothetical protein